MQPITDEIIEISFLRVASWSRRYPVTFMDLRFVLVPGDLRAKLRAGWQHWVRLLAAVCRGRYRLVICRSFGRFIYRPDLPIVLNAVRFLLILFIKAGIRVWQARGAELVIVDTSDPGVIDPSDLFLLDRCKFYFKRELPQNAWYIFARVQPRYREPHDTIIDPIFIKRLKKFRPLSLGISEEKLERIDGVLAARRTDEKDHDVFFAGVVNHSTVRSAGLPLLERLRERGFKIDLVLGKKLSFEEFVERTARAWLVWSPEGLGWDCYRHYEACASGSVPMINYPTIRRHQPLLDGVHCFYYAIEGNGLGEKIEEVLMDKNRLRTMAAAGREHVRVHHTLASVADYLLTESLSDSGRFPMSDAK